MSEYHVVEVEIKEQDALVKALQEMGYSPEVHGESQKLHGYQGDLRRQKAHVIIRKDQVGTASNDIGFEKVEGSYIMHISEYDIRTNRFDSSKLKQLYAKHRILSAVNKRTKYTLKSQKVGEDGSIHIRISRNL